MTKLRLAKEVEVGDGEMDVQDPRLEISDPDALQEYNPG